MSLTLLDCPYIHDNIVSTVFVLFVGLISLNTMGSRPTHVFANGRSRTNLLSVGSDSKKSACSMEDLGSFLGLERSLEEGMTTHSSILAYNIPMNRGAWQTTAHGVSKESDTTEQLST